MVFVRVAVLASAALLALAACSGGSPSPTPSAPSGPPELACKVDCGADGKEVKTTPCAAAAIDAIPAVEVEGVDGKGKMSLRRSSAPGAECDRYLWGKFEAAPDTGQYILVLTVTEGGSSRSTQQASEPKNPASGALTKGFKVEPGQKVQVCVKNDRIKSDPGFCRETTVV